LCCYELPDSLQKKLGLPWAIAAMHRLRPRSGPALHSLGLCGHVAYNALQHLEGAYQLDVPSPALPGTIFDPAPFDGRRFSNRSGAKPSSPGAILRWMLTRQRSKWPSPMAAAPVEPPATRIDDGTIRATCVGHSTVLLQCLGVNILTDPVWSRCAGPTAWLGVNRVRPAAFPFEALPPIDVVLLSHNHYDHLDRPTLARLAARDNPLILTGLNVGRAVPSTRVIELDWWQSHDVGRDLRATYVPDEHFSARGPFDRNASLWGGFVLQTSLGTLYFAGDTGGGPHFAAIRHRFGPMTLSLLPIGAYMPPAIMAPIHINPAEAVAASLTLRSQLSVAIHFATFPLADDAYDLPETALAQALAAAPAGVDFRVPDFGRPITVAPR
jgi:L-ascorbate metabolism protein UlaG (beta-lactamase superfamily)